MRKRGRSNSSDDSYTSGVKFGRFAEDHVSEWDICKLESFGIFYDEKATELSELYESALKDLYLVLGIKDHATLWSKLLEIKEFLVESTKSCMHSLDADEEFSEIDSMSRFVVVKETEKCLQAIAKIKEEMVMKGSASSMDYLSWHIFSIWHTGILEYVEYYSDLIKELRSHGRCGVEGEFSQLLIFFSKIFLLNAMRGDALPKMQMMLDGVVTTSVPDLRYRLQGECHSGFKSNSSLLTVTVGEVKRWSLSHEEKTTADFNIRKLKFTGQSVESLLGRHGGELLVEWKKSALQDTNLGIICIKNMIIFTCLKLDREHLSNLAHGHSVENERSVIRYSKPYNFLVRKDREEIMDTMFHLGLLCRLGSLHLLLD
ncbi:uncharacterized protein LOC133200294 [Saccostrea echinata]|uniref:uncharacterized protein LOC133200294 n=1 Tax=Saccostrea echinata TaxID=191078 RepID=UPI002A81C1BB|nr:uncharacterized protein LOC133200294 [Saccostrea echinata]